MLIFNDENECYVKYETEISSAKSENKAYIWFLLLSTTTIYLKLNLYIQGMLKLKNKKYKVSLSTNPIN